MENEIIKNEVMESVTETTEAAEETAETVTEAAEETAETVTEAAETATAETVETVTEAAETATAETVETVTEAAETAAEETAEIVTEAAETAAEETVETVTEDISEEDMEAAAAAAAAAAAIASLADDEDEDIIEESAENEAVAAEAIAITEEPKTLAVTEAADTVKAEPDNKNNGTGAAVASIVFGLLSIFSALFIPFSIMGLCFASSAKKKGNTSGLVKLGKTLSTIGLILNIFVLVAIIGIGAIAGYLVGMLAA